MRAWPQDNQARGVFGVMEESYITQRAQVRACADRQVFRFGCSRYVHSELWTRPLLAARSAAPRSSVS